MHSLLIKENQGIPFVISQNDKLYTEYMASGYEEITKGTKKECEAVLEETITAYAD